ncbi:tetratricopeptide repeat protein [bacterium]|nr:tetratricopeptide repeat protein [bacterium]
MSILSLIGLLILTGCAEYAFYQAEKQRHNKRYYQSVASYLKFAHKHADHRKAAQAVYRAAKIQQDILLDIKQAHENFSMLVDKFPVGNYTLLAQEEIAHIQKDIFRQYDQAIIEYEKLLDISPDYPNKYQVKKAMAECYTKLNQYEQADIEYMELIKNFPNQAQSQEVFFAIANNAYIGNKPKKAIEYYHKVLEQTPKDHKKGEALFNIAAAYEDMDNFAKAKSFYLQAKNFYPNPEIIDIRLKALRKRQSKKFRAK